MSSITPGGRAPIRSVSESAPLHRSGQSCQEKQRRPRAADEYPGGHEGAGIRARRAGRAGRRGPGPAGPAASHRGPCGRAGLGAGRRVRGRDQPHGAPRRPARPGLDAPSAGRRRPRDHHQARPAATLLQRQLSDAEAVSGRGHRAGVAGRRVRHRGSQRTGDSQRAGAGRRLGDARRVARGLEAGAHPQAGTRARDRDRRRRRRRNAHAVPGLPRGLPGADRAVEGVRARPAAGGRRLPRRARHERGRVGAGKHDDPRRARGPDAELDPRALVERQTRRSRNARSRSPRSTSCDTGWTGNHPSASRSTPRATSTT